VCRRHRFLKGDNNEAIVRAERFSVGAAKLIGRKRQLRVGLLHVTPGLRRAATVK
jgi:hypothetical protein